MKIPDIMEIARSWIRAANPTPAQQALAERRLTVCDPCDQKEFSRVIMSYTCAACGCPLSKKVYSPKGSDACPLNKWPE